MSKIVQLAGAIRSLADAYLGQPRELTVDTSNWNLRLHDGSTEGGRTILSLSNADARYQKRSEELEGFILLEPQQRGLLVRVGPADYRLREIEVNELNLEILNGNGFSGNIGIGLKESIGSDHAWTGDHEATGDWIFSREIQGNLRGDVVGDLIGDVTGTLFGSAQGDHLGSLTGAVDVRGDTLLLDDGQIAPSKIAGFAQAILDATLPSGCILLWAGSIETIPTGWFLCDGQNGTPNLQDRFVIGAGLTHAAAATGGAATHLHTISLEAGGAHLHTVTSLDTNVKLTGATITRTNVSIENEQSQESVVKTVGISDPGHFHTMSGQTDSGGNHSHAGSSGSTNHLPPYYALAYIMKS